MMIGSRCSQGVLYLFSAFLMVISVIFACDSIFWLSKGKGALNVALAAPDLVVSFLCLFPKASGLSQLTPHYSERKRKNDSDSESSEESESESE